MSDAQNSNLAEDFTEQEINRHRELAEECRQDNARAEQDPKFARERQQSLAHWIEEQEASDASKAGMSVDAYKKIMEKKWPDRKIKDIPLE